MRRERSHINGEKEGKVTLVGRRRRERDHISGMWEIGWLGFWKVGKNMKLVYHI